MTMLSGMRGEVSNLRDTREAEHAELAAEVSSVKIQVNEVARMDAQLKELHQATRSKDAEIALLKEELKSMRETHDDFARRMSPEKINQIEEQLLIFNRRNEAVTRDTDGGRVVAPTRKRVTTAKAPVTKTP